MGRRQHRPQTWSWGNDPPENGQHGAVGRQLSAHRPRLCPPEAVRGIGSHPTEVKRSRPISAAIGGRDPRSRAAIRREQDEPCFLWIAEPECGSHSRLGRLQRRPAIVRLRLSPRDWQTLSASPGGASGTNGLGPFAPGKRRRGLGLASEFSLCVVAGRRRVAADHRTHTGVAWDDGIIARAA